MDGRRFLLAIGVVVAVIVISIAIFRIEWGGSDRPLPEAVKPVNIADYSTTDTDVRMTIRGPINSNQEHEQLQITVGRDQTDGDLISGYQLNVVRNQQTGNNSESYKAFLSALHNFGFSRRQVSLRGQQYDGACPRGLRYTFEFLNGGEDAPSSSWATSCGKKEGNFNGDLSGVKNLFIAQVPKAQFDTLTKSTDF